MAVTEFPVRLLQSAEDITTSGITAFLELLLNPISKNFCPNSMNEHCRDSINYLLKLKSWKSSLETNYTEKWIINSADIQVLYPNINRDLVKNSLWHALKQWFPTFLHRGPVKNVKNVCGPATKDP